MKPNRTSLPQALFELYALGMGEKHEEGLFAGTKAGDSLLLQLIERKGDPTISLPAVTAMAIYHVNDRNEIEQVQKGLPYKPLWRFEEHDRGSVQDWFVSYGQKNAPMAPCVNMTDKHAQFIAMINLKAHEMVQKELESTVRKAD